MIRTAPRAWGKQGQRPFLGRVASFSPADGKKVAVPIFPERSTQKNRLNKLHLKENSTCLQTVSRKDMKGSFF